MNNELKTRRLSMLRSGTIWPNDSEVTSILGDGVNIQVYEYNGLDVTPLITLLPDLSNINTIALSGGNSSAVTLQASSSMASNSSYNLTLPAAAGSNGQVVSTTGNGTLVFTTPTFGTVTSVAVTGSTGLSVSGSPITNSGTISLTLGAELQGLSTQSATGLVTRTGTGTYAESTITSNNTANIIVTNGNGVSGNPTIDIGLTPTVNSITINNAPVSNTDGVNKQYADALIAGLDWKNPCAAASTADLGANIVYDNGSSGIGATITDTSGTFAPFVIDGYTANVGDRILIKDEDNVTISGSYAYNGIYSLTTNGDGVSVSWVLTRTNDYDTTTEITAGNLVAIINGTINANTTWLETSNVITIGTDPITFSQFSYGPSSFLMAGNNLSDVANAATSVTNLGLANAVTSITTTTLTQSNNGGAYTIDLNNVGTANTYAYPSSLTTDATGRVSSVTAGNAPVLSVNGTTNDISSTGGQNPILDLINTTVAPGSYTYASLTVDANGRLTSASNGVAPVTSITAGTGLSGGTITSTGTIAIADTVVIPGSYTNASVTVNQQGQLTSATSGTAPVTSVTGGTGITVTGVTTPTVAITNTGVTASTYNYGSIVVNAQGQLTSAQSGFVNTNQVGANDTAGFTTLVSGSPTSSVTISTTAVTTSSIILVNKNIGANTSAVFASLSVGNIKAGVSFTVYSSVSGDTDQVNWVIINP